MVDDIPPALAHLQRELPQYATELEVDSDTDEEEGVLYFRLQTDDTETHNEYTKPSSAVAVNGHRIVEYDIRLGEYSVEQVEDVLERNPHRIPSRLDDGGGYKSITHVRNWNCDQPVDRFLRFVAGLTRDLAAVDPDED